VNTIRTPMQLALIALIAVCSVGVFVAQVTYIWPTPWRYDHVLLNGNRYPVRIHRLNGRTEILLGMRGWAETDPEETSTSQRKP